MSSNLIVFKYGDGGGGNLPNPLSGPHACLSPLRANKPPIRGLIVRTNNFDWANLSDKRASEIDEYLTILKRSYAMRGFIPKGISRGNIYYRVHASIGYQLNCILLSPIRNIWESPEALPIVIKLYHMYGVSADSALALGSILGRRNDGYYNQLFTAGGHSYGPRYYSGDHFIDVDSFAKGLRRDLHSTTNTPLGGKGYDYGGGYHSYIKEKVILPRLGDDCTRKMLPFFIKNFNCKLR